MYEKIVNNIRYNYVLNYVAPSRYANVLLSMSGNTYWD